MREKEFYRESAIEKIKFPRIKHIFDESGRTRDDLLASPGERTEFLELFNGGQGVATEKIDGLNTAIGFTEAGELKLRHRNDIVENNDKILYKAAYWWAKSREELFHDLLKSDSILYVEWMEWEHSVKYDDLSDFAQVIAMYDAKEGKYMSHSFIKDMFNNSGISVVPEIKINGSINNAQDCLNLITKSHFSSSSKMEGVILQLDEGMYNNTIMKFVHPDFRQAVDSADKHWMRGDLRRNTINYDKLAQLLNK